MTNRPRILCLAHRFPYPPNRGDRVRTYQVLRYLAQRADVDLATLADEPPAASHLEELRSLCRNLAVEPIGRRRWLNAMMSVSSGQSASEGLFLSAALRRTVRTWTTSITYDAAFVVCSGMAPYLASFQRRPQRIVIDLVDVDSQKWLDYAVAARRPSKWLFALEGRRLRRAERELARQVDAVTLVSEAEALLFRAVCPNDRTHAIANGVDLDYFSPTTAAETPNSLVFVGALDYRANVLGVRWFAQHVWPELRRRQPDATFSIVGRNPTSEIRQLALRPGVSVLADVPDVRPSIRTANLAIAPLLVARGIQNKVLEAMAMAKPVVVSPQALEGIDASPGVHLAVAADPTEWVARILDFWRDAQLRQATGRAAREFVEQSHCWSARLTPLSSLLALHEPADATAD